MSLGKVDSSMDFINIDVMNTMAYIDEDVDDVMCVARGVKTNKSNVVEQEKLLRVMHNETPVVVERDLPTTADTLGRVPYFSSHVGFSAWDSASHISSVINNETDMQIVRREMYWINKKQDSLLNCITDFKKIHNEALSVARFYKKIFIGMSTFIVLACLVALGLGIKANI